jgi:hypothetical protein
MDERHYRGRKKPLPIGDVYAFPLGNGRFGACRVIREGTAKERNVGEFIVVACAYVGDAPPHIDHPDLRTLLPLTHHAHGKMRRKFVGAWVNGPPPKMFLRVGNIPPSEADLAADVLHYVVWSAITQEVLAEWRWAHDREAVMAEDLAEATAAEKRRAEANRAKAAITLDSFQKRKLFADWEGHVPRKMITAARMVIKETAAKLVALGPKLPRRKARAILRDCIVAFNELDEANDHWIETTEREDIVDAFDILARLAGFADEPELADEWRDW